MGVLAAVLKVLGTWYVSTLLVAVAGILVGYVVFFKVYPGQPTIGVIDIPFTEITDDSAFVIGAFLDFARRTDSIKAVVIKLNSPGGGVAASEQLYVETRKLREKKPVVIAMSEVVASGGYLMSLGANYTFAKSGSLVGSVGVILSRSGPLIPNPPDEAGATTGPFKLTGGDRRHWIGLTDGLKQAFVNTVLTERGDKLRTSAEEIGKARIYSGIDAVRLGMVDAIGGETEAIEKAAKLAGISRYGLVDVNVEVFRILNEKLRRVIEPLLLENDGARIGASDLRALTGLSSPPEDGGAGIEMLRRLHLPSGKGDAQEDPQPGLPPKVNPPNLYYLYVGPSE